MSWAKSDFLTQFQSCILPFETHCKAFETHCKYLKTKLLNSVGLAQLLYQNRLESTLSVCPSIMNVKLKSASTPCHASFFADHSVLLIQL